MELNINRLIQLIKKDIILYKKSTLTLILLMIAFCGIMMVMVSDVDRGGEQLKDLPPDAGEMVFAAMLFVFGIFNTLLTFKEFRRDTNRLQYLTLPASNFEKILSKWLYTLPGFLVLNSIIFITGYYFFGSVIEYLYDVNFTPIWEISIRFLGYYLLAYIVAHSFLFLFALIYNRYVIPKSIITGMALLILTVLILGLSFRLIFFDHFTGFFTPGPAQTNMDLSEEFKDKAENFFMYLPYLAAGIGVPFLWMVSYFKMKEKEA